MKNPTENHKYADLFPMMGYAEISKLAESIENHGLRDAIITFDGKILDGRNRFKACEMAGVETRFEEFTGDDALNFVVDHNLHRRHLDASQRSMVAAKLATLKNGQRNPAPPIGEAQPPSHKDRAAAAEQLNVGTSSVDRAKRVQRDGVDELSQAVNNGEVSVSAAVNLSKLSDDEQRDALSKGKKGIKDAQVQRSKIPKWKPDDAERLWLMAKQELNKILSSDKSRDRVLNDVINYCQDRLLKRI